MHVSRIAIIGALGVVACASNPKPKFFGTAPDLTPAVEIVGTTPLPLHLRITPTQPSYVSAFYVVPGQRTQRLFPTDSSGSALLEPVTQEVATAFARTPVVDSSRLLRRPNRAQPPADPQGNQGGAQRDTRGSFQELGYVVVYAAKDSLNSKALNDRVIGISVPGYTDEALSAVTKLIRAAATGPGPWSIIAVPFKP